MKEFTLARMSFFVGGDEKGNLNVRGAWPPAIHSRLPLRSRDAGRRAMSVSALNAFGLF